MDAGRPLKETNGSMVGLDFSKKYSAQNGGKMGGWNRDQETYANDDCVEV